MRSCPGSSDPVFLSSATSQRGHTRYYGSSVRRTTRERVAAKATSGHVRCVVHANRRDIDPSRTKIRAANKFSAGDVQIPIKIDLSNFHPWHPWSASRGQFAFCPYRQKHCNSHPTCRKRSPSQLRRPRSRCCHRRCRSSACRTPFHLVHFRRGCARRCPEVGMCVAETVIQNCNYHVLASRGNRPSLGDIQIDAWMGIELLR